MRWLPLVLVLFGPLAATQEETAVPAAPERTAFEEVRLRSADERGVLARWAFDQGLYREAGLLAREVLRISPGHEVADMPAKLESVPVETYVERYRDAVKKSGREFRKRLAAVSEPAASEMVALAQKAARTDPALAEEIWVEALRTDPDSSKAKKALEKLDYEVIFNYGVLPQADKEAAQRLLRSLGGGFLMRRGLAEELEFWSDAWGMETRHYRFVTNAPHATVFRFAQACEDLTVVWEQVFGESKIKMRRLKDPLVVYFFDSPVTYQAMLRMRGAEPPSHEGVLGFYDSGTEIGYFYDSPDFYAGDLTLLFETFYHEGTHQLVNQRCKLATKGYEAEYPLSWVNEGLATYMELVEIDVAEDGERSYRLGEFLDDDIGTGVDALLADQLMPTEDFVHADWDTWDAYPFAYQHATLLVHWLMQTDDRRKAVFELLAAEEEWGGLRKETAFELLDLEPAELATALAAHAETLAADLPRRKYAGDDED